MAVLALALAACQDNSAPPPPDPALQEAVDKAPDLGKAVRTAQFCGLPLSLAALDHAARIEAVAIAQLRQTGGDQAADELLRSLQPERPTPQRRTSWCNGQRREFDRVHRYLAGDEGASLASRAEAALNR